MNPPRLMTVTLAELAEIEPRQACPMLIDPALSLCVLFEVPEKRGPILAIVGGDRMINLPAGGEVGVVWDQEEGNLVLSNTSNVPLRGVQVLGIVPAQVIPLPDSEPRAGQIH